MSDAHTTPTAPDSEPGIMGSLPKRRPQRPSARRKAATNAPAAAATAGAPSATRPKPGTRTAKAKPKQKAKPASQAKADSARAKFEPPRAPRQGFEAESDVEPGKTVQPPGGAELAASVVELLGELAQSGLTGAGKLLKDAFSRSA